MMKVNTKNFPALIIAILGLFVALAFFLNNKANADVKEITSDLDWGVGTFNNVENYTSRNGIRLKANGSWGPRVFRGPKNSLGPGSAVVSDGSYLYLATNLDNSFLKYVPSENRWVEKAVLPKTPYYGADLVYLDGYIYASFGGYQKDFYRYSIGENKWEKMSDFPDLVYNGGSLGTDGTDIYALRGSATSDFWKYDVATDTWTVVPSTPATIYGGADLTYDNGYFYTPRGYNRNTFYRYDVSSQTWSTMANIPGTLYEPGNSAIKNGYIYVLRGRNTKSFYRYQISTNTWTTITDAPQNTRYVGVVYNEADDTLYVFRGNYTYDIWKYDTDSDEFVGPADLPATPGSGADLVYYNGYLYYVRGNNQYNFYRYNVSTNTWETLANSPQPFSDATRGVAVNGYLYFFRGSNYDTFLRYDIAGNGWTEMATTPYTVRYGGVLVYPGTGNYIYATRGSYSRGFWRYDITSNTWDDSAVSDLPDGADASYGSTLTTDGTYLYYTSGARTSKLLRYDIASDTWDDLGSLPYAPLWGTDAVYYNGSIYVQAGYYKDEYWAYSISNASWRKLDPLEQYYGYDRGPYNGGSLAFDSDNNQMYSILGSNILMMNVFTPSSDPYVSAGVWESENIDLSYVSNWTSLTYTATTPGDSSVTIETRTSADQLSWSSWEVVTSGNISSPVNRYIQVRVTLNATSDKTQTPVVEDIQINYVGDTTEPSNPDTFAGFSQRVGGDSLTSGNTYSYNNPYFTWSGASDSGSGLYGYYVYFGTDSNADPETDGSFQTASNYLATIPFNADTYYLRIKTIDVAGNVSPSVVDAFTYVYQGASVSSFVVNSTVDFSGGTLTNMQSSSDTLKLESKDGFWLEDRISLAPANIYYGGSMTYSATENKFYVLRGSNTSYFYSYDLDTDTWATLSNTPAAVSYGGSIVAGPDGFLYATRGNNTTAYWIYDIANDTWSDAGASDAPQTFYHGASQVYDGSRYIYVLRATNDDSFLRYDTTDDSWQSLSSVDFGAPTNQINNLAYNGASMTYDGDNTIYVIQGNGRTGFAAYNIEDDSWTYLENTPSIVGYGGQLEYNAVSNTLYFTPGNGKNFMYKYDITTATWSMLDGAPSNFYHGTTFVSVGNKLYVLRGYNSRYMYIYDVEKNSWTIPTRGLFDMYRWTDIRNFSYGSDIIKGNGTNFYLTRGDYDNLFVRYNPEEGEVQQLANIPASFYVGGALGFAGDKIYGIASQFDGSLYEYDISNDSWTTVVTDPLPLEPGSGTDLVYDGNRYLYWIRAGGSYYFYRYDTQAPAGSRWQPRLSNPPGSLNYGAQLVYKDGYIYTMRGSNTNPNPLYRYDPDSDSWTTLSSMPNRVYNDGFLVDGGVDTLYACSGGNLSTCYEYSISGDSWTQIEDAPANIYYGGGGASDGVSKMYMIAGRGTNSYYDGVYTYVMNTENSSFETEGTYISVAHNLGSVYRFANLEVDYTRANNTTIKIYTRTSSDSSTWSEWVEVSNEKANGNIHDFKINSPKNTYIQVKIVMESSDGILSPTLNSYTINYYQDTDNPTNPTSISAYDSSAMGTSLTSGEWYPYGSPYFDWPEAEESGGATDGTTGSGVVGYYVYWGTNSSADPVTDGELITSSDYTPSSMVSGDTYYLRITSVDDAGNTDSTIWDAFTYSFDNTNPTAPSSLSVDPSGYSAIDSFDFTWDAGIDSGSGISEYCYKTDASSGVWSTDQCTTLTAVSDVPSYKTGQNTFYVRTKDNAGNYSSYETIQYYYNSGPPSAPQNLVATPSVSTENSFSFSWDLPAVYFGNANKIKYHYSINALPTAANTTETTATTLSAGPYATLPGKNTFYIVAEDEAGNVDYDDENTRSQVSFTANTAAPGIPTNIDVADVSVKATKSWKLAVSWEPPEDEGAGVSIYKIYRSEDGSSFSETATSSGISYVDTNLEQKTYYYKVKACDNANNCGAFSSVVSLYPDGKFTVPAPLVAEPTVSNITTKKATISWATSRTCDSKVAYGTSSGKYFTEEVSNSTHVMAHVITLPNLSAGTTYYFVTKWTDEDGNTGTSKEYTFTTQPAPTVKDVKVKKVGINDATLQFTTTGASSVKIYYGESTAFGGTSEIATSSSETTYTASLEGLKDGTKYFYKINTVDSEGEEYDGTILDFTTLPRPKVSNVSVQEVKGTAQPMVLVSWETNTELSSIVTYYPVNNPGASRDEVNVALTSGKHRMLIKALDAKTNYALIVSGRDVAGNEAVSDIIPFTTSTDTRPPLISNLTVEGSILPVSDSTQQTQLMVSWDTDEPSTSQVKFGEGSGGEYSQSTQEDTNLTLNHLVIVTGLTPSKVYHLKAVGKDATGNEAESIDMVTITPKATDNALDLVITNLSQSFKFLDKLAK